MGKVEEKIISATDRDFRSTAFLAKCLGDANRLRILVAVSRGKKSVSQIVEELGVSQPLVSHHLKELKMASLVKVERSGAFVYYQLVDHRLLDIILDLELLARQLQNSRTSWE